MLSDHQRVRALSVAVENQETNTFPKAAVDVSMLAPSISDAKFKSCKNANALAIPSFVEFSTSKSPIRFYEDPLFNDPTLEVLNGLSIRFHRNHA